MDAAKPAANWSNYRVFLAIYRNISVTLGARDLGISQSTASRRLYELEQELGAPLFDRTPDGLLPTELAERILPHAEVVEQQADSIARLAARHGQQVSGRVRLALPAGLADLGVVPRLPSLCEAHPGLSIDLAVGAAVVDLVRREADVALRFARPVRGDLVVKQVAELDFGVFGAPQLAASAASMAELPWVVLEDPDERFAETRWYNAHVGRAPRLQTNSYTTLLAALRAGLGLGVIARSGAALLGLQELPLACPPPARSPLYLVTHRALRSVPRIAAVWSWLEAECQQLAATTGSVQRT